MKGKTMDNETKSAIAALSIATGTIVVSAVILIKTERNERAKRREIDKNMKLDLAAIRRASDVMSERLKTGHYDRNLNVNRVLGDLDAEIKFQKIAIREEV